MLNVLTCIVVEHDPAFLAAAVAVCVLGSLLTMRLFARARNNRGTTRISWLGLTAIVGGASIWTTHFVAIMGYQVETVSGYEPVVTLLSLVSAIMTTGLGLTIAAYATRSLLIEAGGAIVGLGIALMHYLGMSAYQVQADMVWNTNYVIASLVLGAAFGALATNRVARPHTRFCMYGGGVSLICAIALMHFTGMTALTVVPSAGAVAPVDVLHNGVMMVVILSIITVILSLGATTYAIDMQTTRASFERYRHLSLHDAMTGLPNRTAFMEHINRLLERSSERSGKLMVLSFDLDRFKEINDVRGHAAGDHVLRTVSSRMAAKLREGEFVARVGGDEFVAVSGAYFTQRDAHQLAQRLIAEICQPIDWNGEVISVGTSIGISLYPDNAETIDDLLAQADVAMYRAKASGSNNICFYDTSMDQAARERNALAMDMRAGFQRGEFELYYQQQNNTVDGELLGFEALMRWNHPVRGRVSPVEFIPIAEKTGLIIELGNWAIREACREATTWKRPLRVAVNVAPQQLANNNLPTVVHQILVETGLAPHRLELEITESGIIADQQHALHIIRQLKVLGVKIAMDDYGTGYSSLSTLQLFPFDKIKIDRGFIDGVATSRQSAAIVRSTLILAASLDIPVLAEGVENEEHIRFLAAEGCHQVQGYFYSRPVPRGDIQDMVNLEGAGSDLPHDVPMMAGESDLEVARDQRETVIRAA